ncbi:MAG: response regulator [Anaerolineae bacterium]|nr:response regulator [Anaerolineae bacterium]
MIDEETTTRKLILYMEDNYQNGRLVKKVLNAKGYDVILAEDGQSGLRIVEQEHLDLILLDINMPGIDGKEAATRLKNSPEYKHIPIVALTALAMRGDREKILAAGCDDYLPKPLNLTQLLEMVQKYIGAPSPDDSNYA